MASCNSFCFTALVLLASYLAVAASIPIVKVSSSENRGVTWEALGENQGEAFPKDEVHPEPIGDRRKRDTFDEGTLLDSHDLEGTQSSVVLTVKVRREIPAAPQYTTYHTLADKLHNSRNQRDDDSSEEGSGYDSPGHVDKEKKSKAHKNHDDDDKKEIDEDEKDDNNKKIKSNDKKGPKDDEDEKDDNNKKIKSNDKKGPKDDEDEKDDNNKKIKSNDKKGPKDDEDEKDDNNKKIKSNDKKGPKDDVDEKDDNNKKIKSSDKKGPKDRIEKD